MNSEDYEANRNIRSQAREALSQFVNSLSILDMDSVRTQISMLSILTHQNDEITRKTEVNVALVRNLYFFFHFEIKTNKKGCHYESMHKTDFIFRNLCGFEAHQ